MSVTWHASQTEELYSKLGLTILPCIHVLIWVFEICFKKALTGVTCHFVDMW